MVIFICLGVGFIVMIAAIVVAIVVAYGKKKKKQGGTSGRTAAVSSGNYSNSAPSAGSGLLYVRIRNMNNPSQTWNCPLSTMVMIGRDRVCQIYIAENSISQQQCMLYLKNNVLVAENLGQTNITQLNGQPLHGTRPVNTGDRLTCGSVTLMIDSIYGSREADDLNKRTIFVNV